MFVIIRLFEIITMLKRNTIFFSVNKISFTFLMTPINSTNDQNNMRRVI